MGWCAVHSDNNGLIAGRNDIRIVYGAEFADSFTIVGITADLDQYQLPSERFILFDMDDLNALLEL